MQLDRELLFWNLSKMYTNEKVIYKFACNMPILAIVNANKFKIYERLEKISLILTIIPLPI